LIVSIHESPGHYEIFHQDQLVARHPKATRHSVRMEQAHYAGLLRVDQRHGPPAPPHFDPHFGPLGEVMVRDLALYEAASQNQGGGAQ
jgi:hypothetical protein